MPALVVVENPKDWQLDVPGVEVVVAKDYLTDPKYSELRRVNVFNLCRSYRYQTVGYYVSLLAAARGHRPMPSESVIQDLRHAPLLRMVSEDLEQLIQASFAPIETERFELSIYFGRNPDKRHDRLSRALFNAFPSPLLRATFLNQRGWRLESIRALGTGDIPDTERDFVVAEAKRFFDNPRAPARLPEFRYECAILVNPEEAHPPSDARAVAKFIKAARTLGMNATEIHKDDYGRIAEFDALFIRETTAVNHHTYRFARRALAEGLVVLDDPVSIVRCTNKVYLAELFARHQVPCPKTMVVHRSNQQEVGERIGFPCVVKQPDSSFSVGVRKAENAEELLVHLDSMFSKTELVVVQEFVPSTFDWRVGVLNRKAVWACKYFMATGDWRIATTDQGGRSRFGKVETLAVEAAPAKAVEWALAACAPIGDGLYGVDIKEVGDRFLVMEVNDNPNLDVGYEDAVLKDELYLAVMRVFVERLEERGKRKGSS